MMEKLPEKKWKKILLNREKVRKKETKRIIDSEFYFKF